MRLGTSAPEMRRLILPPSPKRTTPSNLKLEPAVEIHLAQYPAHRCNLTGIDSANVELITPQRTLDLDRLIVLRVTDLLQQEAMIVVPRAIILKRNRNAALLWIVK